MTDGSKQVALAGF
uniref:Uncharacterized protein n=1 Tax=Rhizophora mucronata TaxID=61149 RepID=A0A2P2KN66_RHIMU